MTPRLQGVGGLVPPALGAAVRPPGAAVAEPRPQPSAASSTGGRAIAQVTEVRRRRVGMQARLDALRKHVDLELGALASELHAIERLEGERAMRDLEPELCAEGAT